MHHQMGVGQASMNFLHAFNGKNVTRGLPGELISTVRGTNSDSQSVQLGEFHEFSSLIRIGQELITRHLGIGPMTIFLVSTHGFQRTQTAQFTFNGNTDAVSHFDYTAGDVNVVFVGGDGFTVAHQRTIHHYGREARAHSALANSRALAVVLMHTNGHIRIRFNSSDNKMT